MSETYPITEARAKLGDLVRRASYTGEHITLTDHGRPAALIVSIREWEELLEDAAALARHDAALEAGTAPAPIPQDEAARALGLVKGEDGAWTTA
jgi:prevent-host-death family protein